MLSALPLLALALPQPIVPGVTTTGYPYVGKFGNDTDGYFASCTSIGSRYILTALHNIGGGGDTTFKAIIGSTEYDSVNVRRFPYGQYDLAVIELDQAFPQGQWYAIYTGSSEANMLTTMVGYGQRGIYDPFNNRWNTETNSYGTRREGTAPVFEVFSRKMNLLFDGGDTPSYSIAAPGDSGGAAFATLSDTVTLVGIVTGDSGYPAQNGSTTEVARVGTAQLWTMGFSTGFTLCHLYSGLLGHATTTNPEWVYYSDQVRAPVDGRPPITPGLPSIRIEFQGHAPHRKADVANLTFTFESRSDAIPVTNLEQRIELWDWIGLTWVLVSTTTPSSADTIVVADPTGTNDNRFVEEGTELVKARVNWYEIGGLTSASWKVEIDQAKWTIIRS
ncbi:MAG: trypsin-like serine protease [Fimbriimonadales bacterium]